MLKKILMVFAILIALLIASFILLNIFYPLDKYSNTNYTQQTSENKKTENQATTTNTEITTQLFTNEDYGYSFSYPESLICEYETEPANVDFGKNGEITNYNSKPRTNMITCALKNRSKKIDDFAIIFLTEKNNNWTLEDLVEQAARIPDYENIQRKNPLVVTDEIIAKQTAKKIVTEDILDDIDEWYDETHIFKYNNTSYIIEYISGTNSRAGLDELQIILDSFQFTK